MIPGLDYTGEQRTIDGRLYNVARYTCPAGSATVLEPVRNAEEQAAYEARVNAMRDMLAAKLVEREAREKGEAA